MILRVQNERQIMILRARRPNDDFHGSSCEKKRFHQSDTLQKEGSWMIFEGPKLMKNHVFLEPRFVIKKT